MQKCTVHKSVQCAIVCAAHYGVVSFISFLSSEEEEKEDVEAAAACNGQCAPVCNVQESSARTLLPTPHSCTLHTAAHCTCMHTAAHCTLLHTAHACTLDPPTHCTLLHTAQCMLLFLLINHTILVILLII